MSLLLFGDEMIKFLAGLETFHHDDFEEKDE